MSNAEAEQTSNNNSKQQEVVDLMGRGEISANRAYQDFNDTSQARELAKWRDRKTKRLGRIAGRLSRRN